MSKYITQVALVGAGGNCGRPIAEALLSTGRIKITALTRSVSTPSTLPIGVTPAIIDYDQPQTLVEAMKGCDALICTLSATCPKETDIKLLEAAQKAGVQWVFPNEWGVDTNSKLLNETFPMWKDKADLRKHIASLGSPSAIGVTTGFWYEWSLAQPLAFGFDFANRKVTFFDDGNTKISVSTWPQVGRSVAAILSLPIESTDGSPSLQSLRNETVYVNSFTLSQCDMFASVLRVTNTVESDWDITYEDAHKRANQGREQMQQGNRSGFVKLLYARLFWNDGVGNFEERIGTKNEWLGLPKEDLDEATEKAIKRSKEVDLWT